eukprot:24103-Eustigmatos_ZCMA.PRE.1
MGTSALPLATSANLTIFQNATVAAYSAPATYAYTQSSGSSYTLAPQVAPSNTPQTVLNTQGGGAASSFQKSKRLIVI